MSISGPSLGNVAGGHTGTDFGQELSAAEQEQFMQPSNLYDATINEQPLDVYMYWAAIERKREANDPRPIPDSPWTVWLKTLTGQRHKINGVDEQENLYPPPVPEGVIIDDGLPSGFDDKKGSDPNGSPVADAYPSTVTSQERERAYRALRVASWQAVFYLITTDILGFSSAPYAFEQLGIGPGVLVYGFFYLLAVFAGQVIWRMYLNMDSSRFPVICYADLGERTFGKSVRHIFNVIQSFQLLFNVALLIIGSGQTLVVMINWQFCYLALNIFFMLVGMIGGQIRSLRNFAWIANMNIWLNIVSMIMTLYGTYAYLPLPSLTGHKNLDQPKIIAGWVPNYTAGWYQQVSGVQLAVFAYGGAMIFPEFMAEMRHPRDFWKSALFAQFFCFFMYMMFGLVVYVHQGQYTFIIPSINFVNQGLILANNIIALITTMVAAVLYGNIGVKVFYENVMRAYFRAPSLLSVKGRFMWSVTVLVYWALAWLIGTAIPNIPALITLVGAACILQFTYTFPPLLLLGHWMQLDAMKADNPWTPGKVPLSNRIDSWKDKSRWVRGFKRYWYAKLFLVLMFLGALANCALGIYAGIETAKAAYATGYNTPFSCLAPSDPSLEQNQS